MIAPKKEAPKEEPVHNNSPLKATNSTSGRGTPSTSKSSKGKRKVSSDDAKTPNSAPLKKVKTENVRLHLCSSAHLLLCWSSGSSIGQYIVFVVGLFSGIFYWNTGNKSCER